MIDLVVDAVLAGAMVLLALATLGRHGDALRSVLLFIAFSFGMMLVWVRLNVPDLALVEAAIGGLVASVVFFDTLGRIRRHLDRTGDD